MKKHESFLCFVKMLIVYGPVFPETLWPTQEFSLLSQKFYDTKFKIKDFIFS